MRGFTKAKGNYLPIETAPKTGRAIRLCLRDGFGTYPSMAVKWSKEKQNWVNAASGAEILPLAVGWTELSDGQRVEYGSQNKD